MHEYKIQNSYHFKWYQSIYGIPKLWKKDTKKDE